MGNEAVGRHDMPGIHRETVYIPTIAAATATLKLPLFSAQFTCRVTEVIIVPQDAVTGDDTDRKNLNVIDAGADGSGTTEIGNLDLASGSNLTALKEHAVGVTDTTLTDGDVLALQVEKVGNGVLLPDLLVIVEYEGA